MGLPKIDQPIFTLTLPSTGKKIKYRPFTVKEEKILLIAKESGDIRDILDSIEQVVNNCIISDDVGIEDLATFDLEFLMLNIRGKAVSDEVKFVVNDPDTEESVELSFKINDIQFKKDPNHTPDIDVAENYKIRMRYPTTKELMLLSEVKEGDSEEQVLFDIMISCIDMVYSKDDTYKMKDFTKIEIDSFVDSLPSSAIKEIRKFFNTIPKITVECPYSNKNGTERKFVIEGVETFFI